MGDNSIQNQSNINMDHMVDSYEIYGENQPEESDIDEHVEVEEIIHVNNKRHN